MFGNTYSAKKIIGITLELSILLICLQLLINSPVSADGNDSTLLEFMICDPGGDPIMYFGSNSLDCSIPGQCGRVEFVSQVALEDEKLYARYYAPDITPTETLNGTIQVYVEMQYKTPYIEKEVGVFLNLEIGDYSAPEINKKKTITIRGFEITYPNGEKVIVGNDEKLIISLDQTTLESLKLKPLDGKNNLFAIDGVMVLGNVSIEISDSTNYPEIDLEDDIESVLILTPPPSGEMILSIAEEQFIDPYSPEVAGTLDPWYPWQPAHLSFKSQRKVEAVFYKRLKKFAFEEGTETIVIFAINTAIPGAAPLTSMYGDVDSVFDMMELFGPLTDQEREDIRNSKSTQRYTPGTSIDRVHKSDSNTDIPFIFEIGTSRITLHGSAVIESNQSFTEVIVLQGSASLENRETSTSVNINAGNKASMASGSEPSTPTPFDPNSIQKWWESGSSIVGHVSDFSKSDSRWTEATYGNWDIINGTYQAKGTGSNAPMVSIFSETCKDFGIAVDIKKEAGDADGFMYGYGLYLRSDGSWRNNYELNITQDGQFMFGKMVDGHFSKLLNWQESKYLDKGYNTWNRLRATVIGNRFDFYANENLIGSVQDDSHKSGKCGLFAIDAAASEQQDTITFDNLLMINWESQCLIAQSDLTIDFPCLIYQDTGYSGSWKFHDDIKENPGLYWKLNQKSLTTIDIASHCQSVAANLDIPFSCIGAGESYYSGYLKYIGGVNEDPDGLYWRLNERTLYAK